MVDNELAQQIALYEDPDHSVHLDVRVEGEMVWLTQHQMATLFGRDVTTIRKHIKAAREEELAGISVGAKYALTATDGKTYQVAHCNLDMILSVGYRVKSPQGVYFRRWANNVLKQHLLQGYSVNRKRLEALGTAFKILERSDSPELAGAAEILQRYLPSLSLLDEYDTRKLATPEGDAPAWEMRYDEAIKFIRGLPFYGESNLFGRERNGQFEGIVNALYQGFGGQDLYPSVQAKAANLLYLV